MRINTTLFFTFYDYARIRFESIFVCLRRFTQITVSWNFTYNPTTFESHGSVASFHTFFLFSFINMSTVSVNNITWNSSAVECLLHSGASQCKEKILGDIGVSSLHMCNEVHWNRRRQYSIHYHLFFRDQRLQCFSLSWRRRSVWIFHVHEEKDFINM